MKVVKLFCTILIDILKMGSLFYNFIAEPKNIDHTIFIIIGQTKYGMLKVVLIIWYRRIKSHLGHLLLEKVH